MKALTIKAPWAQAIAHGTKRIENRTWKPHADVIGQRIAIHCGKSTALAGHYDDKEARLQLFTAWEESGLSAFEMHPRPVRRGHIIGTARVVGWVGDRDEMGILQEIRSEIPSIGGRWPYPCEAEMNAAYQMGRYLLDGEHTDHYLDPTKDFWWIGPIGWLLADVRAVEPVAVRGQVGLWTVPNYIEMEVGL